MSYWWRTKLDPKRVVRQCLAFGNLDVAARWMVFWYENREVVE
jgi:hypothetical protein